ncbi:MAG: hypothetical protein MUO26_04500 [Methanotrichaceae archaeon]|nr:hypothetical protein [Methanotrichaceae archaeon]
MITGGFEAWKGLSLDLHNDLLELLLDEVSCQLKKRGLRVNCTPGDDVIFYLPI